MLIFVIKFEDIDKNQRCIYKLFTNEISFSKYNVYNIICILIYDNSVGEIKN